MKSVAFTFGRFNPPTTGHEKLIRKVKSIRTDKFYIFPSWSENPKKDPLPHKIKVSYLKRAFSKFSKNIISDSRAKTALGALVILYEMGFEEVTMVVGSDRIDDFRKLLNKYNGIDSTHGYYEFPVDIRVVSAGERDPDAEGIEGMSASKLRAAVVARDKELFISGLPSGLSSNDRENLYIDLSKYMQIREVHEYGTDSYKKFACVLTPYQGNIAERPLTDNEKKKKEKIVKALKRDHPNWEKSKMYAIATTTAKKWATRKKKLKKFSEIR